MKKVLLSIICLLTAVYFNLSGQSSVPGIPESFKVKTKQAAIIPKKQLENVDTSFLIKEDAQLGIINRYSLIQELGIDIKANGIKTEILGKGFIWRYQLLSEDAYSLGLLFSSYRLPEGASLFVYNEEQSIILGAFTHLNNKESGLLAIGELIGKKAVIEYFEPNTAPFKGNLVLGTVSQAYREMSTLLNARVGINCPEGTSWQDEKRSVCRMTYQEGRYGYYCTGFLVNNVKEDGTPYFMTANHCISSSSVAATLITYFNYENSTCSSIDASAVQTLSGASLKATSSDSDFTLLLLNEIPPISYQAFLAGWDVSATSPQNGTGIHHPSGAPKCISVDNDKITSYPGKISWDSGNTTLENTHWSVKFDLGNTETGSSGSPLFDENSRVIGQLHGGDDVESFYGKFSVSWDKNVLHSAQLKAWLDPLNSGIRSIGGSYLKAKPQANFSASYTQTCLNEVITLTDETKNFPASWLWKIEPATFNFVNGTGITSRNPQVLFKKGGNYTITLTTANVYGSNTVVKPNFIAVSESINISFSGVPQDTGYCGFNLHTKPLVLKGAHSYSWEVKNTDKLRYTSRNDTLILSVPENVTGLGSFIAFVKATGITGTCSDTDSIRLKIIMPPNDYIKNAIRLWPGDNNGFNNLCGCSENKEPMPPLTSCFSNNSWCPDPAGNKVNSSVWFTFVGPSNGKVTIDTQSGDDNRIAVYEADAYSDMISGNPALYAIIAANDNRSAANTSARIDNLEVQPGKLYWLQVDSKVGAPFSVSLQSNSLEVFPNPNNGSFDVIISSLEEGSAQVKIFSALGKVLYAEMLRTSPLNNRYRFDLRGYPSGLYIIKVKSGNTEFSEKIMVQAN